jgi:hypothetical protein
MNISSILYCVVLCLSICLFLILQHIRPDVLPGDFISPTFNPSIQKMGNMFFFLNCRRTCDAEGSGIKIVVLYLAGKCLPDTLILCSRHVHTFFYSANVKQMFYKLTRNYGQICTLFEVFFAFWNQVFLVQK